MPIQLGPILGFQGVQRDAAGQRWCVGVLVVADEEAPPPLGVAAPAAASAPRCLKRYNGHRVWRYDIEVTQGAAERAVAYTLGGAAYTFVVPAADKSPRMIYTSCNGFSALKLMKQVKDKFANWRSVAEQHRQQPYHLLVMGGDQVYADPLWETIPQLRRWNQLPTDKARGTKFTGEMRERVEAFYFDLYCKRWSEPSSAAVFASVPTLMIWDDHDIFDGWGSYPPELQESDVFQGIFAAAREHFALFQRQGVTNGACIDPDHGFSVGHIIGEIGLLVLDLRSERTIEQVISPAHWERIFAWMAKAERLSHLFVVSSIPVLHPSFNLLEQSLGLFPGQQELEDDLRDHWTSRGHTGERLRLIHRLLDWAQAKGTRVTILSGDVHIAAVGAIESARHGLPSNLRTINQLTSSGIVHPPPAGMVLFALNHLFDEEDEIDRGITGRMLKFPGTPYRFVGKRNWLSLEPDEAGSPVRIWANWHVEGEPRPYTKVIHPG